jgi:hypothetical protein
VEDRETPTHRDAERRMRELVREADLPEPDEVRYEFEPDEVVLLWREPKFAVVIELDEDEPGDIHPPLASESNGRPE